MSYFELKDYRSIIRTHIESLPKKGRGELARMAQRLNVNSTLISQVMAGLRDFTQEQAYSLSQFMGLSELEAEYFLLLVQFDKAGTSDLKKFLQKKIEIVQKNSKKIENRYVHDKKLSDEERSLFYSSWLYSAIRLYTSVGELGQNLDDICKKFSLDRSRASEILHFLEKCGLCVLEKGHYKMAVQNTFLEKGSPHLLKHHSNWRVKAIERSENLTDEELMFTSPVSISAADFQILKEEILKFLKKVSHVVKESPAEDVACLNLDFFWIRPSR